MANENLKAQKIYGKYIKDLPQVTELNDTDDIIYSLTSYGSDSVFHEAFTSSVAGDGAFGSDHVTNLHKLLKACFHAVGRIGEGRADKGSRSHSKDVNII